MTLCESGNRTSNRFAFSNQSPWFTRPGKNGTTTLTSKGSINRYYDPSTDQFLSVDPDVQTTDQPYAFVNDDPLNATDPLGLYHYTYREVLGSVKSVGSPKSVMTFLKNNVASIFPFPITGGKTIRNGEALTLHPAPSAFKGVGKVSVGNVTSTSFTFTVTSNGYFDNKGSTITFSTGEQNGQVYLQQHANAPGETPLVTPIAQDTWEEQAQNLSNTLHGSYICQTSILDMIAGTVGDC
jgi:RHS repeat-associated protein